MDEEEDQMDDVVDTTERAQKNETETPERSVKRPASMSVTNQPSIVEEEEFVPLFENDAAENFRSRWLEIQSTFVDDPSASVRRADELVAEVINGLTETFAQKRTALENQWNGGIDEASTEELRLAVKRYRSFFDRLLSLES